MKYVAVVIKTTSNDPETGQILEIGAAIGSLNGDRDANVPHLSCLLYHEELRGDSLYLGQHADVIAEIARQGTGEDRGEAPAVVTAENFLTLFRVFLNTNGIDCDTGPVLFAGRGAGRTLQFLRKMPKFENYIEPRVEVLDTFALDYADISTSPDILPEERGWRSWEEWNEWVSLGYRQAYREALYNVSLISKAVWNEPVDVPAGEDETAEEPEDNPSEVMEDNDGSDEV